VTNIAHKVIIQQIGTSQVQSSTHSSEGCTTMELDSDRYSFRLNMSASLSGLEHTMLLLWGCRAASVPNFLYVAHGFRGSMGQSTRQTGAQATR